MSRLGFAVLLLCLLWQVIDERLQQLLDLESQRHAQLQPSGNIIQHVQRGGYPHAVRLKVAPDADNRLMHRE